MNTSNTSRAIDEDQNEKVQGFFEGEQRSLHQVDEHVQIFNRDAVILHFHRVYDVIVIGAGAAGLMAAATAAKRGKKTLLIEATGKIGEKIRISGGGRCNFTNINASPQNYLSENPHFIKSALSQYNQHDFIKLVESYDIAYHEKTLGQLFCDYSSTQIIDMLLSECKKYGAEILLDTQISNVSKDDLFQLQSNKGTFSSDSLIIATGGLSIPKIGATDFGYLIAKQFGLNIIETKPALVPLIVPPKDLEFFKSLSGISIDSIVSYQKTIPKPILNQTHGFQGEDAQPILIGEQSRISQNSCGSFKMGNCINFRENILFTHRGLSGPAILQISSYLKENSQILMNLLPDINLKELLLKNKNSKTLLTNFLKDYLPNRFVDLFCEAKRLVDFKPKELEEIANQLHQFIVNISGTEGYLKAEVTVGGVDTKELSSKTMESLKIPNLYFIGEVVDVTGWLGGYNFQWAWSSGYVAGSNA